MGGCLGDLLPLEATLTPTPGGRSVSVSVSIPSGTCSDDHLVISGVTVARQPVVSGLSLPMTLSVIAGMHAPLRFEGSTNSCFTTPVITADGTLYVPKYDSESVLVFLADGATLPPLSVASVGLSKYTRVAAYVESSNTLLLSDDNGMSSKLVAVDMSSRAVRWATAQSC